jgi:ADP-heptose:LPS heptosyltransferase
MRRPQDVLVLRALGIGDLLTGVPALRGLRRAFPDATVTLAAPGWLTDLVRQVSAVDRLLPTEGLVDLDWTGDPPEVAVNLHGSRPDSTAPLRRLRPGTLFGHAETGVAGPCWRADQHERVRWCRLLRYYGSTADPEDFVLPTPPAGPTTGVTVVHPGASHVARHWPPERYAAVARWLVAQGDRVVVTGSAAERGLARTVAKQAGLPDRDVLAGQTGLGELAALIAHADLVVCGDTGVAHLASAYRTPSVVLFGPVPPRLWGPPDRPWHRALWAGRIGDTFADHPDPGLLSISVDDVIGAARAVRSDVDRTEVTACRLPGSASSERVTSG